MKKNVTLLAIMIGLLYLTPVSAQNTFSVGELDPYFSEYLEPMVVGLATGMGSSWAHTAKPHKTLGFDISLSAVAVHIPDKHLSFSSSALSGMVDAGYTFHENGVDITNTNFELPTMASETETEVMIRKNLTSGGGFDVPVEFDAMDGVLPYAYAPNFAIQLAVGLPKGTEIIGRFLPDMASTVNDHADFDEVYVNKLNTWGIGVKHDLKQWIPFVARVPLIEVSALLAYSKFNLDVTSTEMSLTPDDLLPSNDFVVRSGDPEYQNSELYENQGFDMEMSSLVGSILVGANIPVIHPFIGIGFNKASVSTGLTGMYPVFEYVGANEIKILEPEERPISIDEDKTFMNFQAGLNIKVAILTIHAQYTFQEYSMISGGLAIGIR